MRRTMKAKGSGFEEAEPEEGEGSDRETPAEPHPEGVSTRGPGETNLDTVVTELEVRRFNGGDPRAMDRLFFRLRSMLLAVIRDHPSFPYLPATHSAEDVLQELWTAIFERGSLKRFRDQGRGSLRAYLRRCVDHTLVSLVRRGGALKRGGGVQHQPLHAEDSSCCCAPAPEVNGPGPATRVACDDWIRRCEEVLHGKEREVWTLHFVRDLSYKEIADILRCSEAAVRAAYHRALLQLKDSGMFDGDDGDDGNEDPRREE